MSYGQGLGIRLNPPTKKDNGTNAPVINAA
jgi:hypothetical protein